MFIFKRLPWVSPFVSHRLLFVLELMNKAEFNITAGKILYKMAATRHVSVVEGLEDLIFTSLDS